MYNEIDTKKVVDAGIKRIEDVIKAYVPLNKSGKDLKGPCPKCGGAFTVSPSKGIYKCFSCGEVSGMGGVDFVYKTQNRTYPEALKEVADILGIILEEEQPRKSPAKPQKGTYLNRFLKESGLTPADVKANIFLRDEHRTVTTAAVFRKGSINKYFDIDPNGDDVIIEYYDLEGIPVRYDYRPSERSRTTVRKDYFRIRWQFPEEHKDKEGKAQKYRSPFQSQAQIYFPDKIRQIYQRKEKLPRLFIQEGEKKAEKACKHGMPSVAISGIMNIATGGALSAELIKLISVCQVQEVIMIYDSDLFDLSKNIKMNDSVDKRVRNFCNAAINFRKYMYDLNDRNISLEIYIGHVRENEKHDKGVDDLLTNTLKGRESELIQDIESALFRKDLDGKYMQFHKVTRWNERKFLELWKLDSPSSFAERYKEQLKFLPEFKIGRNKWRFNEQEKLESAQPIEAYEKFWYEKVSEKTGETTYKFDYVGCDTFLQNRGFYRLRTSLDARTQKDFIFVHYKKPFVEEVTTYTIRDFVLEFAKEFLSRGINNMLKPGAAQYLGPDRLSQIEYCKPQFLIEKSMNNYFYFKNCVWKITQGEIKLLDYSELDHVLWKEHVRDFDAKRTPALLKADKNGDGTFSVTITPTGEKCQFLQFLRRTSDFTFRKKQAGIPITEQDEQNNIVHLVSKLCAIGFLLHEYKDPSMAKAVVAMDGKISEVGQSNGRSGKSLIGQMLDKVTNVAYIDGKSDERDPFYWDAVTLKTRIAFIDDVRVNFEFEKFFPCITGNFSINHKSGRKEQIPFSESPKLYIATNHDINGDSGSFTARQWKIAFSDWYNDGYSPVDEFGCRFFDDWEFEQWNLLYNLCAECIKLFLRFGCVEAPSDMLIIRKYKQIMGPAFEIWADEYFAGRLNMRLKRSDIFEDYMNKCSEERIYKKPNAFRKKLETYAEYKGYIYNPQLRDPNTRKWNRFDMYGQPIKADKSGGIEFMQLGTAEETTPRQDNEYIPDDPFL